MDHHEHQVSDRVDVARVVVVDDHRTFTDLVCLALDGEPDLECVGTAHEPVAAREQVSIHRPDIVVMDVDLGPFDGLELAAELMALCPEMLVVVLTAHGDAGVLRRAAAVGACALLLKGGSLQELLGGLRNARHGELFVHPGLLRDLVAEQASHGRSGPPPPELTPREALVLQLLSEGLQVTPIAHDLGISVATCRGYVKSLLAKLGAHSQLEAVAIAGRHGLIGTTRPASRRA